ncbi:hypothetical protein POM88_002906 [Heracleum sosnowskyi]|uniref:F-box domain-containing protein n=1 Tax=Heracleum sosnowskyi TaxID=360622 RepID=A0AAD8JIK2_9APIA|nr:hypothetical protein POM88_002906 [Heracleum sosnowskyi]
MPAGILPVELLEEIFTKLPVKSLISLTIICKSWLALISSQSFAKTHLSRYHLNPDTHLLLLHRPGLRTVTISTLNFSIPVTSRIKVPVSHQAHTKSQGLMFKLAGSINGLVCLSRPIFKPTEVVIWNPATHRFREIMVPQLNLRNYTTYVAFGYDCVRDDYKIVCASNISEMSYRFRMYSCNDDSWKELKHGFDFQLGFPTSCEVVKGNPFWIGLDGDMKEILLYVDVECEVIRVYSGPDYVNDETTYTSIMALEDKAAQIVYSLSAETNYLIKVYALEESSGVWTLMYSTESMGLQMGLQVPVLFSCYRNGKFVMEGKHEGMEMIKEEAANEAGQETALAANDRNTSDSMMVERIE